MDGQVAGTWTHERGAVRPVPFARLPRDTQRELTDEEKEYKSKRKLVQEKLIKFATRIPAFMYLTDFRENTLQDVITKLEPELFLILKRTHRRHRTRRDHERRFSRSPARKRCQPPGNSRSTYGADSPG